MRLANILVSLACGLVLAACADRSPTSLAPSARAAVVADDAVPVPLKFHAECGPFDYAIVDGLLQISFSCTANISHLGASVIRIVQVSSLVPGQMPIQDGMETITAANGDQLWIHHVADAGGQDGAIVTYGGPVDILGGTGRFVDATGSGTYGGAANTTENKGYFDLSAMIQYGAANRKNVKE